MKNRNKQANKNNILAKAILAKALEELNRFGIIENYEINKEKK